MQAMVPNIFVQLEMKHPDHWKSFLATISRLLGAYFVASCIKSWSPTASISIPQHPQHPTACRFRVTHETGGIHLKLADLDKMIQSGFAMLWFALWFAMDPEIPEVRLLRLPWWLLWTFGLRLRAFQHIPATGSRWSDPCGSKVWTLEAALALTPLIFRCFLHFKLQLFSSISINVIHVTSTSPKRRAAVRITLDGLFQGYSGWWSPPIHLNLSCTILQHLATSCSLAIFRVVWLVVLQILSRRSASNSLASRTSRKNRVLRDLHFVAICSLLFTWTQCWILIYLDPPIHQIPEGQLSHARILRLWQTLCSKRSRRKIWSRPKKLLKLLTWLQLQNCWYFLVGKYGKCLKHYKARA